MFKDFNFFSKPGIFDPGTFFITTLTIPVDFEV